MLQPPTLVRHRQTPPPSDFIPAHSLTSEEVKYRDKMLGDLRLASKILFCADQLLPPKRARPYIEIAEQFAFSVELGTYTDLPKKKWRTEPKSLGKPPQIVLQLPRRSLVEAPTSHEVLQILKDALHAQAHRLHYLSSDERSACFSTLCPIWSLILIKLNKERSIHVSVHQNTHYLLECKENNAVSDSWTFRDPREMRLALEYAVLHGAIPSLRAFTLSDPQPKLILSYIHPLSGREVHLGTGEVPYPFAFFPIAQANEPYSFPPHQTVEHHNRSARALEITLQEALAAYRTLEVKKFWFGE